MVGRMCVRHTACAKAERTVDALWDAVGQVVTMFEPQECADYFISCGHDPE